MRYCSTAQYCRQEAIEGKTLHFVKVEHGQLSRIKFSSCREPDLLQRRLQNLFNDRLCFKASSNVSCPSPGGRFAFPITKQSVLGAAILNHISANQNVNINNLT